MPSAEQVESIELHALIKDVGRLQSPEEERQLLGDRRFEAKLQRHPRGHNGYSDDRSGAGR
jgi:hypothetical protein